MTDAERENAATLMEFTTVRPFLSQTAYIKCFYCDSTFTETNLAATHLASHETPSRKDLMETHLKAKKIVKVDVSDLKCRICDEKFTDMLEIRKHLILQHKKEFKAAESGLMAYDLNSKVGVFSCCTCKKGFNSFFVLNQHMNVHFSVVCETCGRGFSSYTRLMNHKLRHENGNYRCKICPEVFSNKHKLRHHVSKKHKITTKTLQPSKCPHCPERFSGYHPRMRHLKDVHGIVFTFECADCKAVFPYRRLLTEHTNKIHKQNNQCDYCGKCFGTPTLLRIHAKSHTGEKNYICTICQKAYAYKKGLNRHMKTHNQPTDPPPNPTLIWGV